MNNCAPITMTPPLCCSTTLRALAWANIALTRDSRSPGRGMCRACRPGRVRSEEYGRTLGRIARGRLDPDCAKVVRTVGCEQIAGPPIAGGRGGGRGDRCRDVDVERHFRGGPVAGHRG